MLCTRGLILAVLLCGVSAFTDAKKSRHHRDSTSLFDAEPFFPYQIDSYDVEDNFLLKKNPCAAKFCGRGRECQVTAAREAVCVCVSRCKKHQKLVCGSDGRLYPSHCELHRAACLAGRSVAVDRSFGCMKKKVKWSSGIVPEILSEYDVTTGATISGTEEPSVVPEPPSTPEKSDFGEDKAVLLEKPEHEMESLVCSVQEYEIMKDNLLLYNHAKLMAEDNRNSGKEYLVSIMFSHYDQNNNGALERDELEQVALSEHLNQLAKGCNLADMIAYDDTDKDGRLNINEFYVAFSVSVVSLDKALEVNHLSARVGDNVEIKCDVTGIPPPPIVWRRNDVDLASLNEEEIKVFLDGSLYLTKIQLIHAGNYTCHAQRNKDVVQTHVLTVHTLPGVKVTPKIQSKRPGEEASMFCHVIGEPFPKVQWLKNDEPLKMNMLNKFEVIGNGTELRVKNIGYADTGAYMCQATNIGGLSRDISSLIVQEDPAPTTATNERRFFSFHDWGASVYEPTACRLYHQIQSTDIIPGTQEYVCGDKGTNCTWGQSINVADRYVYVSQPKKDRVLVISKVQMVVVDVVVTDRYPVQLHYVPHLDQVWVLNWRSEHDQGIKTIQIIRDASQKKKHHTVHPEPIDGQFDLVQGLFVPSAQDLKHEFKYGYVTHTNQRGLYKLDLPSMKYVKNVDLTPYNCVPQQVDFSSLFGLVVIECKEPITQRPTGQIVMDYLTDTVITHKTSLFGQPHVSPDSRVVVTMEKEKDGVTLIVQETYGGGLKFAFDVKTTLNISDITFYPSQTTHGYDLYASAVDKEDILFLDLATGKVEMITGVGKAMHPYLVHWNNVNRPIAASGIFGPFMVTPAVDALFVINGKTRTVNCEIGGLVHPRMMVWVSMKLQ